MNHSMHHPMERQRGMSLVELMVGMTLGLLILLGLTSLFVQSKRSFKQDELTARLQEDARFAMSELRHDIGMAGFWANALDGSIITEIGSVGAAAGAAAQLYTYTTPLTVADNAAAADTLLGQSLDDLVAGTDAIATSKVEGFPAATAPTDGTGSTTDANVNAARATILAAAGGIPYLQTNGVVAVMTTATDAPATAAATLVPAEFNYWRYDPEIYWIRDYAITAGDGIPTLVRKYLQAGAIVTESIALGVEDMQIEYGIDTNTDGFADRYLSDPTAAQMQQVTTCRIYLLMRSTEADENYSNVRTYTYSNSPLSPYTPGDKFYRRTFSTTVKVRNNAAHLMLNL